MNFNRPATKSGPLFDLLGAYLMGEEEPDALAVARIRREALDVLKTSDVATGHILLSGLGALNWDAEAARQSVESAVRADGSVQIMMNALVTFDFLMRPDLALPYALALAQRAPARSKVINEVSSVLIHLGRIREAADLQVACVALDPDADSDFEMDAVQLRDGIRQAGIDEARVARELDVARRVLIEARVRSRQFAFQAEADPDGACCVSFELGFYGSIEDEIRLDEALAEKLASDDGWNPSRLSVQMRYITAEEDALVAG